MFRVKGLKFMGAGFPVSRRGRALEREGPLPTHLRLL